LTRAQDLYEHTGMVRMHVPFLCPICGSDDFSYVWVAGRDNYARQTEMRECKGCSVVFHDTDKFTQHRPKVPRKEPER
jgi:DNA-directed RNA polymerase subunit M/transcription elongation factor TFIIS